MLNQSQFTIINFNLLKLIEKEICEMNVDGMVSFLCLKTSEFIIWLRINFLENLQCDVRDTRQGEPDWPVG